jgi:ribosome maturation factor RimP
MVSTEGIRELVEPVLASVGLELWDVEIARDVVRIMVERPAAGDAPADRAPASSTPPEAWASPPEAWASPPEACDGRPGDRGGPESGIDLDALSRASSVLSPVLDTHPEAVPAGRYQLEVSSPGIERTLRTAGQFRRYIGSEITVKTSEPVAGARRHRGRIIEVGATGIDLEPEADPTGRLPLRFDQMDRARTVMAWGPGAGRPSPGQAATGRQVPGRKRLDGRTSTAPTSKDPAS